ncbi:MAG TPA: DNA polymerase III subunit alpha [bacterium]|nr:DNA polymerase III subunit alpha [bacterium]HQI48902.1 DNA polymerase III subunit alpha [bacterium]HQJ64806.1 DNA polymerase III subunit alpha [bacterium]
MDYVPLHLHSHYSLCRGANTIPEICAAAVRLGFSHLALTDTNGLYGLGFFLDEARQQHLQPLVGAHLQSSGANAIVLAKNLHGYHTLCRLITAIHCEERARLDQLLGPPDPDIVILIPEVPLLQTLLAGGARENLYAELVPYAGREPLLRFARQHHIPVAASCAAWFLNDADYPVHRLLRAIDLNTTLERIPAAEAASPHARLLSPREMEVRFPDAPEALENTREIARQCTFDLDFGRFIFPAFTGPNGEEAQAWLREQVTAGARWRYGEITPAVAQRMDYELDLINTKGFAPYFLVVADAVHQAPRTCGRGSAASSLVSYCLGITHVDPIRYDLFFERFLNPGRSDPPDIDVDFPWDERDDILDYLFRTWGQSCVAMIANHNCFKARSAVREIAKVYGLPDAEIGAVTKKMTSYWQPGSIETMIHTHPVFRGTELQAPWPEILRLAERIRGFPRHLSVHCGGVVIAPDGLDRYVPLQPAKKILQRSDAAKAGDRGLPHDVSRVMVVQWEKDQAEEMGLVKMDILGNRSLAVIRDARAAIRENYGLEIDFRRINPLEDPATQDLLARGDTIGVFYVESPAMRQLQRKTGKGDFEHLVIHSSIIRPAAAIYINEYVRRLNGGCWQPLHPRLESLLKETYGIMVYQEDVSKVAIALADFDASAADGLRKVIGKKHKQRQLAEYQERFYAGAARHGATPEVCDQIWAMILSFAEYSFCKPHSASFALVSFQSAWLRAHYPAEFIAAVISNQGGYYSTFAYISEARRMGLEILPPDINQSSAVYTGKGRQVRVGLMQLKSLTREGREALLAERARRGPFESLADFLKRTAITPADAALLIKAGCFDGLEAGKSRPQLLWQLRQFSIRRSEKPQATLSLFENEPFETAHLPQPPHYSARDVLRMEEEILGFLLSAHPLELYRARMACIRHVRGCDLEKYVGERVTTIGWLITAKLATTKNRELMEFLSFEDTTAIYETTFFPRAYEQFAHRMTAKRPFVLYGKVDEQFGAVSLIVEKVTFL